MKTQKPTELTRSTYFSHIDTMFHLKLIDLIYPKASTTVKFKLKQLLFDIAGYDFIVVGINDLEIIESERNIPKKGQYVRVFLDHGYKPEQIAEWFEITPAAVSWHKTNIPKKSVYYNQALKGLMQKNDDVHTRLEEESKHTPLEDWVFSDKS